MNLACDEHSCYAQELELQNLDRHDLQVAVYDAQRGLERLRGELKLNLDDEEPICQDMPV